jgi:release factor glutamine methyltransferase
VWRKVAAASERLLEAGIPPDEARLDARLLAQAALGWTSEQLLAASPEDEPPDFSGRFDALVSRRAAREPLAYIVGRKEFWGLTIEVTPAVLIPRPETELIVEAALERLPPGASSLVCDVGTGSGCLAIAIAHERPLARVTATDLSADALAVARRNAERHGVMERLRFVHADLLNGVPGPFDLIVSNPPYVPARDRATLQPEVRNYEPQSALFAGADGLDVIVKLVDAATERLARGGHLIVEFGAGQHSAIEGLIDRTAGLELIEFRRDLARIPRTAIVRRHGMLG